MKVWRGSEAISVAVTKVQRGSSKGFAWQCSSFGVAAACFHETIPVIFARTEGPMT